MLLNHKAIFTKTFLINTKKYFFISKNQIFGQYNIIYLLNFIKINKNYNIWFIFVVGSVGIPTENREGRVFLTPAPLGEEGFFPFSKLFRRILIITLSGRILEGTKIPRPSCISTLSINLSNIFNIKIINNYPYIYACVYILKIHRT